ncbi:MULTISPECIES: hypothetical protein [unclassified Psychrobacter]|uniref:hypothetical protein n=1 Tax=unclassified Psychrobacter TaxID=196806 RepID=UPI0018F6FC11|nr:MULTISPECIES: hypothetical protein [unclassified Psychrobacter]
MQPKHIIIAALVGIVALIVFNVLNSHSRPEVAPVQVESSSEPAAQESAATVSNTETAAPSLGEQPKAILDNVHNNIDAAEAKEADKMAQVEGSL